MFLWYEIIVFDHVHEIFMRIIGIHAKYKLIKSFYFIKFFFVLSNCILELVIISIVILYMKEIKVRRIKAF